MRAFCTASPEASPPEERRNRPCLPILSRAHRRVGHDASVHEGHYTRDRSRYDRQFALRGVYLASAAECFAERTAFHLLHFEVGTGGLFGRKDDFVRIFGSGVGRAVRVAFEAVGFVRTVGGVGRAGSALRMVVYVSLFRCVLCGGRLFFCGRASCTALKYGERYRCRYQ